MLSAHSATLFFKLPPGGRISACLAPFSVPSAVISRLKILICNLQSSQLCFQLRSSLCKGGW